MPRLAIIGGTGFYQMDSVTLKEKKLVDTQYGPVTVSIYKGATARSSPFCRDTAKCHVCAPHKINYRANIMALKMIGVERIIGICSVGSLRKKIKPGELVLVDQFLDFTKSRPNTFFEEEGYVVHTDVTEPYCADMREYIASLTCGDLKLHKKGTYVCAEGPRFETSAEIKMFAAMGGDVVGMTGVPECVLARELGLCYACISVVTNYAAGIGDEPLRHGDVKEQMKKMESALQDYVVGCLSNMPADRKCGCKTAHDL